MPVVIAQVTRLHPFATLCYTISQSVRKKVTPSMPLILSNTAAMHPMQYIEFLELDLKLRVRPQPLAIMVEQ